MKILRRQPPAERNDIRPIRGRQDINRHAIFAGLQLAAEGSLQAAALRRVEPSFENAFLGALREGLQHPDHLPPPAVVGDIETDDREFRRMIHQTIQNVRGRLAAG